MHYALIVIAFLWFVFLAPLRVTLLTSACCLAIAFGVRVTASAISGVPVGYGTAVKSVCLSAVFLLVAMVLILGGLRDFSFLKLLALNPLSIMGMLLGAYVVGYHLCLGTKLWASAVIAFLSAIITIAVIFGARSLVS